MASTSRDGLGRASLVDSTAEALRSRISTGDLAPSDRLPPERVLAEELGVSRTVVREALSSLEALGLIEARGAQGRFVSSGDPARSRTVVSAWLHHHAHELLEVDEIRSVLETHAIRSLSTWEALDAARRATEILRAQESAIAAGDPIAAAEADGDFHRLLCSYTKNAALGALADGLVETTRRAALAVYSLAEAAERSLAQHAEIVDVLVEGDTQRAAELAGAHMMDVARRYAMSETGAGAA
jgi:GntR family transcriptional repressor for pyruvate dehydrogenase complex